MTHIVCDWGFLKIGEVLFLEIMHNWVIIIVFHGANDLSVVAAHTP